MKITVEIDMTPKELREFIGLPNVERIQDQLIQNAEKYLADASSNQYGDLITTAMQPMLAYQQWLQRMMTGAATTSTKDRKGSSDE
ncbi:MAG: DUF6489 family protein [Pseudomonadota bacterium]